MNASPKITVETIEAPADQLWRVSIDLCAIRDLSEIAELMADELQTGVDPKDAAKVASLNVAIGRMLTRAIMEVDAVHEKLREDDNETHG